MHFQIKAKGICQISFGATYSYLLSVPPNFLIYYLSQPQTTPISLSIIVLVSSPFFYTLPTFSCKTIDAFFLLLKTSGGNVYELQNLLAGKSWRFYAGALRADFVFGLPLQTSA